MTEPLELENTSITDAFDPDWIEAPVMQKVYEYWLAKSENGKLPSPEDVDIMDLDFAIGKLSWIDVVEQTPRFKLRMVGSEIVSDYGIDLTGQYVNEIEDEVTRDMLLSSYTATLLRAEPFWIKRRFVKVAHFFNYECLILPFADNSGQVIRLLSVRVYPD